jgi:hypothetical protein
MLDGGSVLSRTRALRGVRVGSVAAIALAAALLSWLLVRHHPEGEAPAHGAGTAAAPQLVSEPRLRTVAATLSYPVYWAAPRQAMRYELTQAGSRTYIRYLPTDVAASDPRPRFLTIGTYAERNAFAQMRVAGRRPGAVTLPLGDGGIAVYSKKHPTSVYFSYPRSGVQVEVYDPNARTARGLVLRHRVVPIG